MLNYLISYLSDFNFATICIRIIVSIIAGGVIGNERGKHGSAAGLRTHILVCIGSAMTALTGIYIYQSLGISGDVMRLAAQVISGIGFLGAGMIILKNGNIITGLTTAAGMWATAAIGIALGYGFYTGALVSTFACVFTSAFLSRLEKQRKKVVHIYSEIDATKDVGEIADKIRNAFKEEVTIETIPPKSNLKNTIGFYITVSNFNKPIKVREQLKQIEGVILSVSE